MTAYTEQLAEWVKKRTPRRDQNLVAFLAVRTDVEDALNKGYSQRTIWEHMYETGRLPYRYETFLKHVRRYINRQETTTNNTKHVAVGVSGFKYNSVANKEDLI